MPFFEDQIGLNEADIAVQDSDLVGFYELKMLGDTKAVSEDRADLLFDYDSIQLKDEIKRDYRLTQGQFTQVLGQCIANIAGIQTGKELFKS